MAYSEALAWQQYRQLRGPLNLGLRLEGLIGVLTFLVAKFAGHKVGIEQFTPHFDRAEPSAEDALALLMRRSR